jgi:ElaB/YqjD/DUF883 family membrane-anchored ribosome-binding protein
MNRHTTSHDTLSETRERAEHIAETVAERANEARARVETEIGDGIDRLESQIRRHPLTAAGVAVGVGFVLAFLLRR